MIARFIIYFSAKKKKKPYHLERIVDCVMIGCVRRGWRGHF